MATHEVQSAAPQSAAIALLRAGRRLPNSLITALLNEGHDIEGLVRSIRPASI